MLNADSVGQLDLFERFIERSSLEASGPWARQLKRKE
jgi:hypothetical protein